MRNFNTQRPRAASREVKEKHCYDYPRPAVTVDVVLLRRRARRTEVLLIKRGSPPFKGSWALPGGFVEKDESLESAAARELREETGISGMRLKQIAAFGDPGRDPRGHTISIAFGAVLRDKMAAAAGGDAEKVGWYSARKPPGLAFDHHRILRAALKQLLAARNTARVGGTASTR